MSRTQHTAPCSTTYFPSFAFLTLFDLIISSCTRTASVSRHCPRPSFHRLHLGRTARKHQTTVRVALVPSAVQGRQKYLQVPARGESGSRIGYAETPGIPCHAPQRPCTDLQTVRKPLSCLGINADVFAAELGLVELKTRAFEASVLPLE
jgi:hypothetical protein